MTTKTCSAQTATGLVDRELAKALADAIGWADAAHRETGDSKYLDVRDAVFAASRLRNSL